MVMKFDTVCKISYLSKKQFTEVDVAVAQISETGVNAKIYVPACEISRKKYKSIKLFTVLVKLTELSNPLQKVLA